MQNNIKNIFIKSYYYIKFSIMMKLILIVLIIVSLNAKKLSQKIDNLEANIISEIDEKFLSEVIF
jgi:hypothetical protein